MAMQRYEPSPTRQTPATDQLFAVRVHLYNGQPNPGANYNFIGNAPSTAAEERYYVPPNSVVIGPRTIATSVSAGAAKRRSIASPVHSVVGCLSEDQFIDFDNTNLKQMRVFGIAPEGIPIANAKALQDSVNHDSLGRFSVIHHGVATISVPYQLNTTAATEACGHKDKKIGDVVIVNAVDAFTVDDQYGFNGDPGSTCRPIPIRFISRNNYHSLMSNIPIPNQNSCDYGLRHDVGAGGDLNNPASEYYTTLKRKIMNCMVGFVLETGGSRRNEIRVMLRLDSTPTHDLSPNVSQEMFRAVLQEISDRRGANANTGSNNLLRNAAFADLQAAARATTPRETTTLGHRIAGPFTDSISGAFSDGLPDDCYDGNAVGSVLGMAGAVIANQTNQAVGSIAPGTDPRVAAACFSRASNPQLGLDPTMKPVAGSLAAAVLGHSSSAPATSSQMGAISEVLSSIADSNASASNHTVKFGAVEATMADIPPEVVASHHLVHPTYGTVANPAFVEGLSPEGITLCPYKTSEVANTAEIQKQIAAAMEIAQRSGVCVHSSPKADDMAQALGSMF